MGQKAPKPDISQDPNGLKENVFTGSDLYVQSNTGLIFAGDPVGKPHPQIYVPAENQWIDNPLIAYPGFTDLDENGHAKNRPLVTGFLSHDDAPGLLPNGVTIAFFSKVPYKADSSADVYQYASEDTYVAAYNKDGSLLAGFTPFTVHASQVSAAYDADRHSIVMVGNANPNLSSHRIMWKIPLASENLDGVKSALSTVATQATQPPSVELNRDNRENQLFIVQGHPILISASQPPADGGLKIFASNTLDSLPQETSHGSPIIVRPGGGAYGASATLTTVQEPNGDTKVTINGLYSLFNVTNKKGYHPAADTYISTVVFHPKPQVGNNPPPTKNPGSGTGTDGNGNPPTNTDNPPTPGNPNPDPSDGVDNTDPNKPTQPGGAPSKPTPGTNDDKPNTD